MRKILLTITAIGILSVALFAQAKTDTIQHYKTLSKNLSLE